MAWWGHFLLSACTPSLGIHASTTKAVVATVFVVLVVISSEVSVLLCRYGMSECTGPQTVNYPGHRKTGASQYSQNPQRLVPPPPPPPPPPPSPSSFHPLPSPFHSLVASRVSQVPREPQCRALKSESSSPTLTGMARCVPHRVLAVSPYRPAVSVVLRCLTSRHVTNRAWCVCATDLFSRSQLLHGLSQRPRTDGCSHDP